MGQMILPVRWRDDGNFYAAEGDYLPVPDPDQDPGMKVLEWEMQPGDAILFDFRTVHGARGNMTAAGAARCRCAGSATMRAISSGPAAPLLLTQATT